MTTDARSFCRHILERGDLASKLETPTDLSLGETQPALWIRRPARDPALTLGAVVGPLPRPGELSSPSARAACLARFAHHELMAVELFAWALLRWPAVAPDVRRGWLATLVDEQRHCKMYIERLQAHGSQLSEHPVSEYFWKQAPGIAASPHGPRAFVCALGLTLEQANLDFTLLYRDAFRGAGDEESARVCQRVHHDEVVHVRRAVEALRLLGRGEDEVALYREAVPFPLAAARAKGRRFDEASRRRAGLSEAFIAHVRSARSSAEQRPRRSRTRA